MTDQTRWGIDLVHTKNKAIKRQKDIINRAIVRSRKARRTVHRRADDGD